MLLLLLLIHLMTLERIQWTAEAQETLSKWSLILFPTKFTSSFFSYSYPLVYLRVLMAFWVNRHWPPPKRSRSSEGTFGNSSAAPPSSHFWG